MKFASSAGFVLLLCSGCLVGGLPPDQGVPDAATDSGVVNPGDELDSGIRRDGGGQSADGGPADDVDAGGPVRSDGGGLLDAGVPAPSGLTYQTEDAFYILHEPIELNRPQYAGTADFFSVSPGLPVGLMLDSNSGTISGTPMTLQAPTSYVITASNPDGSTSVTVTIEIGPRATLSYPSTALVCTFAKPCSLSAPTANVLITKFEVTPFLPAGLVFDSATGAIAGATRVVRPPTSFRIFAVHEHGTAETSITVEVRGDISTCTQLQSIPAGSKEKYTLISDVDCGGIDFKPLVNFGGTLDGQHHLITNLFIDAYSTEGVALLSRSVGATVQDLGIVGAVVNANGSGSAAIIASYANATAIRRCFVTGTITNIDFDPLSPTTSSINGSLAGNMVSQSTIEDSFSRAVVNGGISYAGGAVGYIQSANDWVRRVYAVSASVRWAGGVGSSMVSSSSGKVTDSFAIAQPGASFAQSVAAGQAANNVALTPGPYNSVADGGTAYFQGSGLTGKAPFTTWDFANVWQETTGYPSLRDFSYPPGWDVAVSYVPGYQRLATGVAIAAMNPIVTGGATLTSCTITPTLPAGLVLDANTCAITGTPSGVVATGKYKIVATTSAGDRVALITLLEPRPALSYPGGPFTFDTNLGAITPLVPTAIGGEITKCFVSPPLPQGLSASSNCTISGTPAQRMSFTQYTVYGANSGGWGSTLLGITHVDPLPTIEYLFSSLSFPQNVPLAPIRPVSFINVASVVSSATLPAGLRLNATTGVIEGTPTSATPTTAFTLIATNSSGQSRSFTLSLAVTQATAIPALTVRDFDLDAVGAPVAIGMNGTTVVAQPFDPAGMPGASIALFHTISPSTHAGPYIARSRASGRFAVITSHQPSEVDLGIFNADASLRAGPFSFVGNFQWLDVAIDDQGRVAFVTTDFNSPTLRLYVYDSAGALLSGMPLVTASNPSLHVDGLHVAISANGSGVVSAQASTEIFFRRFSTVSGTWVDAANVAVANDHSGGSDSHALGVNANGSFVILWLSLNQKRLEAAFFDSTATKVGHALLGSFPTNPYEPLRNRHVKLQSPGNDFILPYHDEANGAAFFNTYARFTEAGALKGTAGPNVELLTLVLGPSSVTWVRDAGQLSRGSFVLLP